MSAPNFVEETDQNRADSDYIIDSHPTVNDTNHEDLDLESDQESDSSDEYSDTDEQDYCILPQEPTDASSQETSPC